MISDEEIDTLRALADRIRHAADYSIYGSYKSGDPRNFTPDFECSTEEERARHELDCRMWESGNPVERKARIDLPDGGYLHPSNYGLGVQTLVDDDIARIAQDLDDLIDRIRQVEGSGV